MKKILLLVIFFTYTLYSQNITVDNNKDFDKALGLYNTKKYQESLSLFRKIENRTENNSKASISGFFILKILDEQKKYSEVEKFGNDFLVKYPESKYVNEVKYLLIKSNIERSEYSKAFGLSIELIESSKSIVFINETKDLAEKIAVNYLSSSNLESIQEQFTNSTVNSFLLLLTGKVLLIEGDRIGALKKFSEIISKYNTSDEYIEALNQNKNNSYSENSEVYPLVAILLSLTDQNGRQIEVAKEMLEGIKFAFHEYNIEHSEKVGIVVKDIQRDKSKTIDVANEVISNSNFRCIIGPIFSDDVRNVLQEIDRSNICLISPTATDDDLLSLSNNFYQANPSLTFRGKIFAQYIYFVENKRRLAILNSIEGYSPLLAASFTKEFEKLGGKIVAKETYKSKSFSLTDQITRLSSIINSIEGIYAPISDASDATAILSQMVQTGVDKAIYGNQDWFLGKGFESSSSISNKLTFDSDYFIDFNDSELREVSIKFKKVSGLELNRNILYGYDTAKFILTVMRNIDPTRKNIKYKIESGINVSGFHNNISFDSERSNKYLNIVRFNNGVFELVDKFREGD